MLKVRRDAMWTLSFSDISFISNVIIPVSYRTLALFVPHSALAFAAYSLLKREYLFKHLYLVAILRQIYSPIANYTFLVRLINRSVSNSLSSDQLVQRNTFKVYFLCVSAQLWSYLRTGLYCFQSSFITAILLTHWNGRVVEERACMVRHVHRVQVSMQRP